ncbi:MAG: SRPBCC domain-containing protein [Proteobacteria bacterium]|nr:SRPBCC domain-containing protein [Pseudomonadota bacterium]
MDSLLKPSDRELVLTRVLAAPREQVFAAWTDPARAAVWWAPAGFTLLTFEMDARPGGKWLRSMKSASGAVYVKHGVYREVVRPEKISFTYNTEDEAGVVDPETVVTVTLEDLGGGRTRLTLHHTGFDTVPLRDDHGNGWSGAMDRLRAFCATPT